MNVKTSLILDLAFLTFTQLVKVFTDCHTTSHFPDCGVRPIREGKSFEEEEEGQFREARIVGGKETQFGDWPWQVLVKESTLLGLFTKNKCGGVLISDKHVLTAAHCQPGFLASLMVELGEYDITGECTQCEKLWKIHTVKHKPIYSIVSRKF